MITLVKNLFKNKKKKGRGTSDSGSDYQAQTEKLKSANEKERITLAKNTETQKEILYYLAESDPSPKVRKAVAGNKSTPMHASGILAQDSDQDVRLALAARLMDLLPDLSKDKHSQLYAFAVQALGTLALDEVLKVRVALSSTLKDHAHAPPKVAAQLARDVEREVSEPILRFCAALSDEDLLCILQSHPASWAIEAIAERSSVSAPVSLAVIETNDRPAGKALISNEGADMNDEVLHEIVGRAREFPEWHKPIATRSRLPASVVRELADFVDASVRDVLMAREDIDPELAEEVAAVFRRRMDFATEDGDNDRSIEERLKNVLQDGRLNEETISDALAMRDHDFVNAAIARMIKTDSARVSRIFEMKAPKPIIALSWHAGLSMRMALQLQKDMGMVPPKELIYPRDGTDYPLSEDDINWQLEFLGLKKAG
ncbi:MAG: hypothetical protein CMH27_10235 [Micavibrio sp.]|nr:hypothetical protein [Micavibrio sp.]